MAGASASRHVHGRPRTLRPPSAAVAAHNSNVPTGEAGGLLGGLGRLDPAAAHVGGARARLALTFRSGRVDVSSSARVPCAATSAPAGARALASSPVRAVVGARVIDPAPVGGIALVAVLRRALSLGATPPPSVCPFGERIRTASTHFQPRRRRPGVDAVRPELPSVFVWRAPSLFTPLRPVASPRPVRPRTATLGPRFALERAYVVIYPPRPRAKRPVPRHAGVSFTLTFSGLSVRSPGAFTEQLQTERSTLRGVPVRKRGLRLSHFDSLPWGDVLTYTKRPPRRAGVFSMRKNPAATYSTRRIYLQVPWAGRA